MAEPRLGRQPGWLDVGLVAAAVVAVVTGAAVLTSLLPQPARDVVSNAPVLIVVLIVGTGWLLWRISRDEPPAPDG